MARDFPEFYEDPYFAQSQEFLFPYGTDILKGDIPEYYRPIGEWGGAEFEDILGLATRDITKAGLETGARLKKRGGRLLPSIAREVGEMSKKFRFEDYVRALKGREFLFAGGKGIAEGVRGAGLQMQEMKNVFGLKEYTAEETRRKEADALWREILTSGIGTLGTIYGMRGTAQKGE